MNEWCAQLTRDEALALLEEARIPAGPVQSPRQVLDDESDPRVGALPLDALSGCRRARADRGVADLRCRARRRAIERRPPTAGEHTDEVLQELGYSSSTIDGMRARGVV